MSFCDASKAMKKIQNWMQLSRLRSQRGWVLICCQGRRAIPPAALSQPADGQAAGRMKEEGEEGRRGGVEVREGHSRPAAPRAEEPGSASPQTEPALFLGGRTLKKRRLCPSCLHTSQGFQGKKCLRVSRSARNNTESSSSPLWNGGGWRW